MNVKYVGQTINQMDDIDMNCDLLNELIVNMECNHIRLIEQTSDL